MKAIRTTPAERLIALVLTLQPGMTADEIAEACHLNRRYLPRLLRVLILTGVITRSTDGRYSVTATGLEA